jgi:iron complex outermembrane recepter protein
MIMRTVSATGLKASLAVFSLVWANASLAQSTPPQAEANEPGDDEITVTGWRLRELDVASSTASRLGLSIRDTPATIDQIDSAEILPAAFERWKRQRSACPA